MARNRLSLRQRDVKAVVRAVTGGGLKIARIDVHQDGGVSIIPGEPDPGNAQPGADRKTAETMERLRREIEED
jgi:hypothetical protein